MPDKCKTFGAKEKLLITSEKIPQIYQNWIADYEMAELAKIMEILRFVRSKFCRLSTR